MLKFRSTIFPENKEKYTLSCRIFFLGKDSDILEYEYLGWEYERIETEKIEWKVMEDR